MVCRRDVGPPVEMFVKGQAKQKGIPKEEALQEIVKVFRSVA